LVLTGACGCAVENGRVVITIDEIANHRDLGDLSGTLAIELWALERPYSGGGFAGTPLSGTSIGELAGQRALTDCRYDLLFQAPPPGTWCLTLMLREWTAAGHLTRDYVNFTSPYVVEHQAPTGQDAADTLIEGESAADRNVPPAMPAEPKTTPPTAEPTAGGATAPSLPEPPPDPAISLRTESAVEPVAVEGLGAKLMRMVRHFIKM
jgi:hypothetical protein